MGKTARETYVQTMIRSELMLNALQINEKNYALSTFSSSNRGNFEESGKVLVVSVSEFTRVEFCSSGLLAHTYKIVTTTVVYKETTVFVIR